MWYCGHENSSLAQLWVQTFDVVKRACITSGCGGRENHRCWIKKLSSNRPFFVCTTDFISGNAEYTNAWMASKKWFQQPACYSFNIVQAAAFWNRFFSFLYTVLVLQKGAFSVQFVSKKKKKKSSTVPLNKLTLGECKNCTVDLKQFTYFCYVTVCVCVCVWNSKPFLINKECLFVSRSTVSIFCINLFSSGVCVQCMCVLFLTWI